MDFDSCEEEKHGVRYTIYAAWLEARIICSSDQVQPLQTLVDVGTPA